MGLQTLHTRKLSHTQTDIHTRSVSLKSERKWVRPFADLCHCRNGDIILSLRWQVTKINSRKGDNYFEVSVTLSGGIWLKVLGIRGGSCSNTICNWVADDGSILVPRFWWAPNQGGRCGGDILNYNSSWWLGWNYVSANIYDITIYMYILVCNTYILTYK